MFELLATIDPLSAIMGGLWLFAAGMFPAGFMLGSSCSPCCGCSACDQGSLPETLTVEFSGIPETTPGPDLISLSFSSCFGSGASGRVTAPGQSVVGGDPAEDRGPISGVEVTSGGSGYAKLGRAAPTVTVTGTSGSGTGATFSVTLATSKDSCGLDRWAVSKVEITGGTGYADGDTLTFAIAEGDTQEVAAAAEIDVTTYAEPTLSLSVPGGSGAVLQIDGYTKSIDTWGLNNFSDTWRISGITVANGGTGYTNDTLVTVTLGQDDEARPGAGSDLRIRTGFRAPNDDWTLQNGSPAPTGTGLVLSLTLVAHPTAARTFWVDSWAITNGGTGYAVGQRIRPLANEGNNAASPLRANLQITAVDSGGAVTAIDLVGTTTSTRNTSRGRYSIETGVITSVENLFAQAGWRKAATNSNGVVVTNGGFYYREDASLPPYVAAVTVGISQAAPSQGSGASISATVGSDPADAETFGKITGLTIDNGGDGYLDHELFASCLGRFNGRSIVVRRNYPFWYPPNCCPFFPGSSSPDACTYGYTCANTGDPCSLEAEAVRVEYRGPSEPMTVFLMLHQRGQTTLPLGGDYYYPAAYGLLTAQENVQDCSDMDITAHGSQWIPPEATAVITSGGEYEETDACKRITEEDMAAVYTEVIWGDIAVSDGGHLCGWRSYVAVGSFDGDTTGPWCEELKQQPGNEFVRCFERRIIAGYGGGAAIHRNAVGCGWEWLTGGQLCVTIERQIIPGANFSAMIRLCQWCYPITDVTYDAETLLPSGIQLGPPTYYTLPASSEFPPWVGTLLSEAEVCQNPGTPTITFSSLP